MTEHKEPMTLSDLAERINRTLELKPGRELTVCIPNNKGGMGGTSVTYVTGAHGGIDWDAGKFFIQPEVKMVNRPHDFTPSDYEEALQRISSLKTALHGLIHAVENDPKVISLKLRFCKQMLEIFDKKPS